MPETGTAPAKRKYRKRGTKKKRAASSKKATPAQDLARKQFSIYVRAKKLTSEHLEMSYKQFEKDWKPDPEFVQLAREELAEEKKDDSFLTIPYTNVRKTK